MKQCNPADMLPRQCSLDSFIVMIAKTLSNKAIRGPLDIPHLARSLSPSISVSSRQVRVTG